MKIAIVYYSTYGHVVTMAEAVKLGIEKSGAASEVTIFQIPETLPQDVLDKLHAPKKPGYPAATVEVLSKYDAFVFGYPTRFGNVPAQVSSFLDQTGGLWTSGGLAGKPAALFTSTSSPGGGQEATLRGFLTYIAHHGMIFVPLGYASTFQQVTSFDEVHGGTPYGASCFAGADGSRQPSALEKEIAEIQGETFAKTALKFVSSSSTTEKATDAVKKEAAKSETAATGAESRAKQSQPTTETAESSKCAKCVIM